MVICASRLKCVVARIQLAKWYMLKITVSILSREEGVKASGVARAPGTTLSASFSFEPRSPSGFVLFQVLPDVAYFSVDAIVNLFTFNKYVLKLCK